MFAKSLVSAGHRSCLIRGSAQDKLFHFTEATRLYPYYADAWINAGVSHSILGNHHDALKVRSNARVLVVFVVSTAVADAVMLGILQCTGCAQCETIQPC